MIADAVFPPLSSDGSDDQATDSVGGETSSGSVAVPALAGAEDSDETELRAIRSRKGQKRCPEFQIYLPLRVSPYLIRNIKGLKSGRRMID